MDNEPWRLNDPKYKNDPKVYIPPSGPGIDPARFGSSRGQRTLLFMMVPTVRGATSNQDALRYPQRVGSMRNAINNLLNRAPGYTEHKYVALNPDNVPGDEEKMWTSLRGTVLFQYDPNSNGNGKRAWRLWMEDRFTSAELR